MMTNSLWRIVKDGCVAAFDLFKRHYTYHPYKDGRRNNPKYRNRNLFVGPGEKLVLLTHDNTALFVWRKFKSKDNQEGINCAVFRNEGDHLSSTLILEAEEFAKERWPGQRMYTYVSPYKIRSSNPGVCFKKAGWSLVRDDRGKPILTKRRKLIVLEKLND